MNPFYTYVYLDTRKCGNFCYGNYQFEYEPFYIGKGSNGRCYKHLDEAYSKRDNNDHKCNIIRKIKKLTGKDPQIVKLFENLTETDAFKKEIELIKIIGRQDIKTGPLANKAEGGTGFCGFKLKPESIEKMRQSLIRFYKTHKNPFHGKKHLKETKIKMQKAKVYKNGNPRIGVPLSNETKIKISKNVKRSAKYKKFLKESLIKYELVSPNNKIYLCSGQEDLKTKCERTKISFYALLKYINHIVPTYILGIGIGTVKRINTNGWKLNKL